MSKNEIQVTVVIPVYNVDKYLSRCLESVVNQTYKNIEIILVDDGSTDKSGKMCDEFSLLDSRIKVLHQENLGLSAARNAGIEIANGEYITFLDSDDWFELDFIESLVVLQNKYHVDIIATKLIRSRYFSKLKCVQKPNLNICKEPVLFDKEHGIEAMLYRTLTSNSACGKLYNIKLFNKIKFPIGKLYEDFGTLYKIFYESNNILISFKLGYHYFERPNSIITSPFKKNDLDFLDFAYEQLEFMRSKCPYCMKAALVRFVDTNQELFYKLIRSGNSEFKQYESIFIKNTITYSRHVIPNINCSLTLKLRVIAIIAGRMWMKLYLLLCDIKNKIIRFKK